MISKISSLHAIGAPVPPAVGGALFWRVLAPLGKRAHQTHPRRSVLEMRQSSDRSEVVVNGKSKYSADSIRFLLGPEVCPVCEVSSAMGFPRASTIPVCAECGECPERTVRAGFCLNEHRLDGKMLKPRARVSDACDAAILQNFEISVPWKLMHRSTGLLSWGGPGPGSGLRCYLVALVRLVALGPFLLGQSCKAVRVINDQPAKPPVSKVPQRGYAEQ